MPWHADPNQDLDSRRQLISLTCNYLTKRTPPPSGVSEADHQKNIVDAARKMEVALYKASKTKWEYLDTTTLKQRIQDLEKTSPQYFPPPPPPTIPANAVAAPSGASVPPPPPPLASNSTSITPTSNTTNSKPKSDDDIVKQRRTRLVLLKHASRCTVEKCPTPHCASMKSLWAHVGQCHNLECQVPHCVSSHYVLAHFHRCRDPA